MQFYPAQMRLRASASRMDEVTLAPKFIWGLEMLTNQVCVQTERLKKLPCLFGTNENQKPLPVYS